MWGHAGREKDLEARVPTVRGTNPCKTQLASERCKKNASAVKAEDKHAMALRLVAS